MGNRFSRRRDVPITSPETVATQQKSPVEPAGPAEPAHDSGMNQSQELLHTEKLEALVEEPVASLECPPKDESTLESTEVETPAVPVHEPEPEVKETPAPVQPEPLVAASKEPEPEPAAPPKPVAEAQIAPEPAPEPVPEAESAPCSDEVTEAAPEPIPEPEPSLEQPIQESLPEPGLSIPLLIDLGAPDDTFSPAPAHVLLSPDEPSSVSGSEQCKGSVEAAEAFTLEPEKSIETSEFLEKQIEVEAGECLETLGSDINGESLREILKGSELKGNDLHSDFIPSDVNIPDDTPITEMSPSIEMM
ncbi:protein TsetseEP-like [Cololabis saira]|uniref:protein TsetseEP-like n=1 Tax=Cololabis saira TaxID=129043 RepID=UPI002AD32B13|nr:protein TsetseEP-like [Cololabis saira]